MTQKSAWKITGHDWAVNLLQKQIANDKIRHAYLFVGMKGVGRRTLALRFAQALNCPQPVSPGVPCGKCHTCDQIERMQYPDLSILKRSSEYTRIIVDQIRSLKHNLALAPYEGKYRIGLCLNFEEANDAAQTAFLKTLEEAPAKVILMITADAAEVLLPTIVSRCEVLRLHPMTADDLEYTLAKSMKFEPEESKLLAHYSQGCVGKALEMHADPEALAKRRSHAAQALDLLAAPLWERFKFAEKNALVNIRRESETYSTFQSWLFLWSDLLTIKTGASNPLIHVDQQERLQNIAEKIKLETIKKCLHGQQKAFRQVDQNVNGRLLTEILLLDWPRLQA